MMYCRRRRYPLSFCSFRFIWYNSISYALRFVNMCFSEKSFSLVLLQLMWYRKGQKKANEFIRIQSTSIRNGFMTTWNTIHSMIYKNRWNTVFAVQTTSRWRFPAGNRRSGSSTSRVVAKAPFFGIFFAHSSATLRRSLCLSRKTYND